MKKILSNLLFLFLLITSAISLATELTDEREKQLIKNLEQVKQQTGNASEQYINALTQLGEAYENDSARRQQYKRYMVELISYIRTTFGESFVSRDTIENFASIFEEDGDYDGGLAYFESYRDSLNPDQYRDLKNKKVRDDLNLLRLAYIEKCIALMYRHKEDDSKAEAIYKKYLGTFDDQDDGDVALLYADFLYNYSILKGSKNQRNDAANLAIKSFEIIKTKQNLNPSYYFQLLHNAVTALESANRKDDYEKYFNQLKVSFAESAVSLAPQVHMQLVALIYKDDLDQGIDLNKKMLAELEKTSNSSPNTIAMRMSLSLQYLEKLKDEQLTENQKNEFTNKALSLIKKNIFQLSQEAQITFPDLLAANVGMLILFQTYYENNTSAALASLHFYMLIHQMYPQDLINVAMQMTLLCTLYDDMGEDALAIFWGKQAVNALQSVKFHGQNRDTVYLAENEKTREEVFPVLSDVLARNGRVLEAQQILQMLKENELAESLRSSGDDPRKSTATLTKEEVKNTKLYSELAKKEHKKFVNAKFENYASLEKEALNYKKLVEKDLKFQPASAVNSKLDIPLETLAFAKAIKGLAKSEPNAQAVGIQYYVSKDTLNINVASANALPAEHQIKIDSAKFNKNLRAALLQIHSQQADPKYYEPSLKELYSLLIAPILPDLRKYKAKTLMFSLNGQLRLLPFSALMDANGHYLLENYTVALYNEAANQTMEKPSKPKWQVAAMGLSNAVGGLKPLTAVPEELKEILNAEGIEGDEYLNNRFTRDQFISITNQSTGKPYNVLHVASHFELQPSDPGESSLYMGDGTKFTLKEMTSLPLNFNHFDLVTYSACQTAVTGNGSGKEMESLSAQTQRQGAQAVIATLWNVSDQSTAKLMQGYYSQRSLGLNKAEALRAVQLNMALGKAGNANWKSPHHWAGFVISGNWR